MQLCLWHKNSELMPNPNLLTKTYDPQRWMPLTIYLKVPYIALFAGRIFCCHTGSVLDERVNGAMLNA